MYIKKYIQFFGILSALLFTTACGGEDIPSGGEGEGGGTGDGGSSTPVRTSLLTSMSSRWKEKTPLFPVKVR